MRILKLLKQYGASFEYQNYRGDLPFHEAVQTGSQELVEWLLSFQPTALNAANFQGRTPLHLAAANGNLELVVMLCSRGAEINPLMLYKRELYTPLDLAKEREHELVVEYLTQRHEALSATEVAEEQRRKSKVNIEEALKTAKLRRIRAQISESDSESELPPMRAFRRGKSQQGSAMRELADAAVNTSRRSSSASGMRINLPKATSTSDLSKFGDGDESRRDSTTTDHNDMTRESTGILSGVEKQLVEETIQKIVQEELRKAAEREQTDQRNRENVAPNERARAHFDRLESLESALENGTNGHHKQVDAKNGANGMERRGTSTTDEGHDSPSGKPPRVPSAAPQRFRPKRSSAKSGSRQPIEQQSQLQHANKDSFEFEDDDYPEPPELSPERVHHNGTVIERKELHPSDSSMASSKANGSLKSSLKTTKKVKMVVDPSKPLAMRNYHSDTGAPEEEESDEEFYRQSWENGAAGGRRQPGSPWPKLNTAERRYLHEKAIFQELTHLKRTQIQYGKVQEKILVRSLINNFCKMHALNPAHFKNYDTFYAWEKFLYDQLKLIYMEERDRISATGAFPHPPRTPTAVKFRSRLPKASPLHERIRELTRIYSSSTNSIRAPSVKKYQPRRDFVCGNGAVGSKTSSSAGGGGKRCECLGKHLLLS